MKRFHVHVSVSDLSQSVRFYSELFGRDPTIQQPDYAKWMLDDPRINFAISTRHQSVGVNHFGLQVDTDEELRGMQSQLQAADANIIQEKEQPCCYAKSDKYWVTDPTGIAWEAFHTLASIPVYGKDSPLFNHGITTTPSRTSHVGASACVPSNGASNADTGACCGR